MNIAENEIRKEILQELRSILYFPPVKGKKTLKKGGKPSKVRLFTRNEILQYQTTIGIK